MTQKIHIYKKLQNEYQTNLSKRDTLQELNVIQFEKKNISSLN